jgi:hypothetical protein
MIKTIPKDVKILLYTNKMINTFLDILIKKGILEKDRIIEITDFKDYFISAKEFYITYMTPRCLIDANYWYSPELMGLITDTILSDYKNKNLEKKYIIIMYLNFK